jgi:hypothetical protein
VVYSCSSGPDGCLPFIWTFGISSGGFHYSSKMFVFQKVRARNFARAWGFLQAAQALPLLLGLPAAHYIAEAYGGRSGLAFSGASILVGSSLLFLINLHKHQLRQRRHNRRHLSTNRQSVHSTSTKTTSEAGDSYASPDMGGGRSLADGGRQRTSFRGGEKEDEEEEEEEEDMELIPALAQFSNQQCLLQLLDDHYKVRMVLCLLISKDDLRCLLAAIQTLIAQRE